MGQLKLYLGPSGPYYYFEKYIFSKFKDNADKYIYLLPVNRAVRYFKKQLIIGSTNKTMIDPPVFTFNTLIRHLYQYQTNKKKIASNTIRLIILKESLKNCNDELTYFKNQRLNDKGLIKKIDQMLLEFCQFGYYPSDFTAPPPSSSEVYFDFRKILNRLYQTYQNQLVDETSLFLEVVRDLNEQWFRKSFADTNTIFINGYGIYTPPMIEFIKKIKQWCDLEIKIDYDPCNRQLFQHTFTAFDSLQKVADHMINTGDPHDHIARHLFAAEFSSNNKITPKNKIKICKARNRREEISFIAATIKDYHRKYNIPLHKIAVTFPNVEKYFSLLTTVFKQYEIPYNISTGFSLAQSPLIKAYLQVIKAVLSNFRLEDIYQLITSPFLTWEYQIDPIIFSQLSSRLGLRHFGNDWYKGIEEVIKCKSEYDKYQNSITATSFEEKVKTTIKGLQWLFRILLKLKKKFSARDFHTAYLQVLKKLGMLDWYARENDQLNNQEKEKEFRAFNKFNKITDQLCWILTFLYPDRKFTLNEFYQYLILIIENSNFNLREWANYGIQIMPRLEIQSIQSNILFIGGLVDGEFPRKTIQNIFFNDEECKSMGIYSSEDIQAQDRFLFYQLISAHADEIILTYPAGEEEFVLLPSIFLSVLRDIFDIEFQSIKNQDLYPAKYQLKEKIATGLKSDLSKKDLKLLGDVIHLTGYDEFKIWLDNIAILYNKKSRLKVSSHEGDLTVNPFINKMLENKFKDKYLSITELESYAFCPMQFFLKYILNLQEEREIEEKITPLEKGLLLHKILFQFYATLKQRKLQARPWENLDLLLTIAQGEFDRLPYQGLLWQLEKEEYFGFEKKEGLFKTFLALEKKEIEERGFIPAHFEVAFGISPDEDKYDQVSSERPFIIRKEGQREIKLSGKIDRIDLDSSGNLIVYDYKIGRIAEQIKMSHIFNGTSLQLPVYLAAINDMLRDYYKKIYPVGGVYYQIKDSENCAKYPVIIDGEKIRDMNKRRDAKLPNPKFTLNGKALSFWEIINHTLEFVMKYVQAITQGNFRHTHHPSDMRCSQYCEFAMICRKDVNKLKVMNFDIC